VLALLVACDGPAANPQHNAREIPRRAQPETCLPQVWAAQEAPNEAFDVAHDAADGGAISCATGTTASQFEAALRTLREAAQSGRQEALIGQVAPRLLFIDAAGKRRELADRAAVQAAFDAVFQPDMLALIGRARLNDMTVAEGGGFFALGALWLVPGEPGGRPAIQTVNLQALNEAAAAD
jgi:hypothetical protein